MACVHHFSQLFDEGNFENKQMNEKNAVALFLSLSWERYWSLFRMAALLSLGLPVSELVVFNFTCYR